MRHHTRPARVLSTPRRRSTTPPSTGRGPADPVRAGEATREAPALEVAVRQDLARPLITVAGELDLASAGLLTAMLDHARRGQGRETRTRSGRRVVEVDLSGVTFADSCGLAPVLEAGVRVVAASEQVRRVLRLLSELPPAGSTAALSRAS